MLKLTAHAKRRMASRRITEDEIEEALANRMTVYLTGDIPDEKVVILGNTEHGRRLKIVVLQWDESYVITVADRDEEG
jgi:hypothetical protein